MKIAKQLRIGFIGAGNMAEAIVSGLIKRKVEDVASIMVSDPSEDRRKHLERQYGVSSTDNNQHLVASSDVIIIAVKPQILEQALTSAVSSIRPDHLFISIAAGIRTEALSAYCHAIPAIVRIMPNTPALVGKGVSAICVGPRATDEHVEISTRLFASIGDTLNVAEAEMDAITAISGSGPAYIFYWMEAMLVAAKELGFDAHTARKLVYGTFDGAIALAGSSLETPDVLRARVTSKGGTTEAAMNKLDHNQTRKSLIEAIHAAAQRSRELSAQ